MKSYKMIGIAVAAFALASLVMAAGPRLVEQGIAIVIGKQDSAKPAAKPAASNEQSTLELMAVATAQEATSLQQ
jgi:hypothetical protein